MLTAHARRQPKPQYVSQLATLCVITTVLALPACEAGGHFTLLGYSSRPLYDTSIRTIYVPIFKNTTFRDSIRRDVEYTLTWRVIQEIESKTPYKVVSKRECADTELLGTVIQINKMLVNISQENEIRQGDTLMSVEIVWRDLRPGHEGEVLSAPAPRPDTVPIPPPIAPPNAMPGTVPQPIASPDPNAPPSLLSPVDPETPEDIAKKPKPKPVLITTIDTYAPELGQSTTTALQGNMDRIATQIVSMMEMGWSLKDCKTPAGPQR